MDRSPLRRGQETVYRRWGDNTAILSGDAMSIEAYASLAEVADKSLLAELLPRFSQMALEVCVGQQYDMEFETRSEVRVEEYMEMIRLKTSVLLGSSLELGGTRRRCHGRASSRTLRRGDPAGAGLPDPR